jgi:alpha-ketoglutarate-dependent taurine dioxygenase
MGTENESVRPEGLPFRKRKPVSASQQGWVKEELLLPELSRALLLRPAVRGVDLVSWASSNRDSIESRLSQHGAILFRNFNVDSVSVFEDVIAATSQEPMDYGDRTSPRDQVSGRIYTSTTHPADQTILLHNENSYSWKWPAKIYFHCVVAPPEGGETPIADCRKVLQRISPELRQLFEQRQVMYVRNFGDGFGLPWQAAFGTKEKQAVEAFCSNANIKFEWKEGDRLKTRQVRPAVVTHPGTGEMAWFNQAVLFHFSSLGATERAVLASQFAQEDLPSNCFFGDGSEIEPGMIAEISEAYRLEKVSFSWQQADVLLLDNMLTAHGREPFVGPRQIVVGMADPKGWDELDPRETQGQETAARGRSNL